MFTITHDRFGTVTAETEADARKAIRKLAFKARKTEKERNANRDQAYLYAYANAYRVLQRKAAGEAFPGGWSFHVPEAGRLRAATLVGDSFSGSGDTVQYDGEHGRAVDRHPGYRLAGMVEKGTGYVMLIWLRSMDRSDEPIQCFAVGVCGDQLAYAEVTGVSPLDFRNGKEI
jgi:hypothetical protein